MTTAPEERRTERILTADGVSLALHRIGLGQAGPVVMIPGTFSNHTFWLGTRGTGFARAVARAGFESQVLDPRGHGASQRHDPSRRWSFDDWARYDVPASLQASPPDRKPILVGHSAGGAAVAAALAAVPAVRERVRAVALISTPLPWLQWIRGAAARLLRAVAARTNSFPARTLRLGPEDEPSGVMEQWMTWNIERRWSGRDGTDYGQALAGVRTPVLALSGAGDRAWAPPHACQAMLGLFGSEDSTYVLCGKATGFSRDYGHTDILVSRAARAEVWPILIDWLTKAASRPGS